jgi:hypothetical protein
LPFVAWRLIRDATHAFIEDEALTPGAAPGVLLPWISGRQALA